VSFCEQKVKDIQTGMSTLENEVRLLKRANQNFEEEATNFKINIENKTAINNDKDA